MAFILDTRGRISERQTILCLVAHVLVPRRPIWKQQRARARQKGSSKRKINFLLRTARPSPVLILIHFGEAAAVIDSRGKVCSYTNHFSSAKYRFNDNVQWVQSMGQRERYIMGKARLIMGDHRAISITLTSAPEYAFAPYSKCTQRNGPVSELVSFILTAKFAHSRSLLTRSLHLGGTTVASVND